MQKVTILIPTYNRPRELHRNLNYLRSVENPYPVIVLDGSKEEFRDQNRNIAASFDNVEYPKITEENLHFGRRLWFACQELVKTKYVVVVGDDDFLIPAGIAPCADFLDEHPDYSCAIGNTKCLVYTERRFVRGGFVFQDRLQNRLILREDSFVQRYTRLNALCEVGCSPLFYGVRRREQAAEMFQYIESDMLLSAVEKTSNVLTCIFGKVMGLNVEYDIRDYSCPTDRSPQRNDPVTYLSEKDMRKLRPIYARYLKAKENQSDEIVEYVLDQFVKFPLPAMESFQEILVVPASRMQLLQEKVARFAGYQISKYFPTIAAKMYGISYKTILGLRYAMLRWANFKGI